VSVHACRPVTTRIVAATALALAVGVSTTAATAAGVRHSGPRHSRQLAATLNEFTLRLDRRAARSGRITFKIHNRGHLVHEFVVLKTTRAAAALPTDGDEVSEHDAGRLVDEAENINPGRTAALSVKLKPGRYVLICNLPHHYAGGMHASLRIR
jgi:uncharacterized cupredoxin-like copper-binding protein